MSHRSARHTPTTGDDTAIAEHDEHHEHVADAAEDPETVTGDLEVQPHDSVSQVGSTSAVSKSSSQQSKLKAKAAILKAKADALKKKHEIEVEEQRIKQMKEALEIETELAVTNAEMEVNSVVSRSRSEVVLNNNRFVSKLNPDATPWSDPQLQVDPGPTPMTVQSNNVSSDIANGMRAMIAAIHLPHAELMPFDGDPLQYWPFVRAFKSSVEDVCDDDVTRLTRLLQYCTGRAKRAIQSCSVMPPSQGYKRALQLLKDRFGNEYTIAEAWIKTITDGKPVTNAESLRQFADDLRNCKETLEAINYMNEVNTQRVVVKLVERLPHYLRTRWVRHVADLRIRGGRVADFNDIVTYVEAVAEEANDPVYGKFMEPREGKHGSVKPQHLNASKENNAGFKSRTFNTVATRVCPACGADHYINACDEFKALDVDGRRQLAKTKGLCFNCLRHGHKANGCRYERTCSVQGCGKRHSSYLHKTCLVTGAGARTAMLPLIPVKVRAADGQRYVKTLALLDSGSTTTFCTERLAKALHLQGKPETLTLSTMESANSKVKTHAVSLDVLSMDEQSVVRLDQVYTRPYLPISSESRATASEIEKWPHLKDVEFYSAPLQEAELLIGQDCSEVLQPLEMRRDEENLRAPYAVRTALGWTVQGPLGVSDNQTAVVNFVKTDLELQRSVEKFWKLDSLETAIDDTKGMSIEDRRALAEMEDSVSLVDGHYELAIPFKHRPVTLPNNRPLAAKRLQSLGRKLSHDTDLHEKYCKNMDELVANGYSSKVEQTEIDRNDGMVWYLPHHAVINPKKPDKVRVVFDCAARFGGTSLNDKVLQGPDLTNQLIGVLLRFREEPVAIMADIQAMFHQVRVLVPDRDVLRYLWWPDGDYSKEPDTYHMNVHLFGGTWSPSCCGFALRKVAEDNKTDFSPETVNTVYRNFYVDDCLKAVQDEEQAIELVDELVALLKRGGFRLRSFVSTSRRVLMTVPESDKSHSLKTVKLNCGEQLPTERALGVSWNVEDDCFVFSIDDKRGALTRRGMLSVLCSIYDPAGYLAPFTLIAKRMMQELTRKKVDWDELLPEQELREWSRWLEDRKYIENIQIPRCLRASGTAEEYYELHHFADASNTAYGAVTYLRAVSSVATGTCHLLLAKSRLAPIKAITIPRLELMAATLAVKLDVMIKREIDIPIQKTVFWTDSSIVLQYINNDHKRFHTFVANRIAVIREASEPYQWRHIPSACNPADDASRGLNAQDLVSQCRWWNGPRFLSESENSWPQSQFSCSLPDDDPEVKKDKPNVISCVTASGENTTAVDKLFSYRSDWSKLKKDVAWLRRYMMYLKQKCGMSCIFESGHMTVIELDSAETVILCYIQRQCFAVEVDHLIAGRRLPRSSSLYRLCPVIMSNDTVCVGGRLRNASVPVSAKHPVILPRNHHVVDLIVRHEHETNAHVGREHVLSLLREKYWIVRGRSTVRRILSKCVTCRRLTARCGEQRMEDLPSDRVTADKPPFTFVGVDLFGPFLIRRGRSEVKRYGCVFTCLVMRAVHIEVVYSLDTDSFLNAVMRFISRRGKPMEFRSDNATNFKAGDRELKEAVRSWNQAQISNHLTQNNIEWKYNPPGASHMGGVWERQIRSVRKVLNSLLKEQCLDDEALCTVMCQAEHIVNSRPLTAVSDDINDLEALTPAHLLNLHREPVMPPGIFVHQDNYVRRRWRQVQYIADLFWRRWTREYLPLLQQRQKWCTVTRDLQVGDIVLLAEEGPRNCWPLARIIDVHKGNDGHVRSATVRTKNTTVVRPITKLCLLECADN